MWVTQFLALGEGETDIDRKRHVGLAVDDLDAVERRLDELGVERLDTGGFDVRDQWGNRLQFVAYVAVQFTNANHVLDGMGFEREEMPKGEDALAELAAKGMGPDED